MSDICVLPSIWDDPAPLAVIESLVSGKPLITTRSGGIPEYADEQSAIILERSDQLVDQLANAMTKIARAPTNVMPWARVKQHYAPNSIKKHTWHN